MKAAGQVIQYGNVSMLRDTGYSHEPTPPAGMAEEQSLPEITFTVRSWPIALT